MMKRCLAGAFLVVAAIVLASGLSGCSRARPFWENRGGPPRVVVTIPALENFVRNVGGNHVGVVCLCTTQGPHHYEYNPEDAILLRQADLFFAIGLTLDDKFADPIQAESHNPHLQYVRLGERLPKKLLRAYGEEHEHGHAEEEHDHEHGQYDPHVWLGIPQAVALVEIIRDELKKVDPKNEADYDANAGDYIKKLTKLHADGKERLKDKKNRKIIAFHESLAYFAKSFDVEIAAVLEEIPGTEAGQARMAQLAKECKEKEVRVIAVEPQYSPESSAKLLKEQKKDMVLVEVDPLETVDKNDLKKDDDKALASADWYVTKMRHNLDNLAKALP